MTPVRIGQVSWSNPAERAAVVDVRREVFVVEQEVPVEIELDGRDPLCIHLLARDERGRPIGTARMDRGGHIGRIAVRADWRGRGVGAQLVRDLVSAARGSELAEVHLDSQVHAVGFYEKLGFEPRGEEFLEAGIPHRTMSRRLGSVG